MDLEVLHKKPSGGEQKLPLLLVHGAWHGAWCWDKCVDEFTSRGYEVYTPNLPGHGSSAMLHRWMNCHSLNNYVNALAEVVDGITPTPVVIGHSMGGAVVQKYLETRSLPGAVLIASVPTWGLVPMITRTLLHHPWATSKALAFRPYELVRNPRIARKLLISDENPIDFAPLHKQLSKESYLVISTLMWPFCLRSSKIDSPVLVVAVEKDKLFRPWEQRQTHHRIKDSAWHFEPDVAHDLMFEPNMPKVVDAIDAWLHEKNLA